MNRFIQKSLTASLAVAATAVSVAALAPTASAAPTACTDVDVVTARGTYETGTLGSTADAFYASFKKQTTGKTTSAYKVNYPASLGLDSNSTGQKDLVAHVTEQSAACPNQKFVLMGFSQGANVVGNVIGTSSAGAITGGNIVATVPSTIEPKVAAVVLFGYPNHKRGVEVTGSYAARTRDICSFGDLFCDPGGISYLTHISYGLRGATVPGATFAAGKV